MNFDDKQKHNMLPKCFKKIKNPENLNIDLVDSGIQIVY